MQTTSEKPQPKSSCCVVEVSVEKPYLRYFYLRRLRENCCEERKKCDEHDSMVSISPLKTSNNWVTVVFLAKLQVWPARPSLKHHYNRHVTNFHLQMAEIDKNRTKLIIFMLLSRFATGLRVSVVEQLDATLRQTPTNNSYQKLCNKPFICRAHWTQKWSQTEGKRNRMLTEWNGITTLGGNVILIPLWGHLLRKSCAKSTYFEMVFKLGTGSNVDGSKAKRKCSQVHAFNHSYERVWYYLPSIVSVGYDEWHFFLLPVVYLITKCWAVFFTMLADYLWFIFLNGLRLIRTNLTTK